MYDELWVAIGAFLVGSALNLYWDILKPELAEIWSVPADSFWWKMRESLIAAVYSVWYTLKAAYQQGLLDAVISIIVKIIRAKFGLPTAARKASAAFKSK